MLRSPTGDVRSPHSGTHTRSSRSSVSPRARTAPIGPGVCSQGIAPGTGCIGLCTEPGLPTSRKDARPRTDYVCREPTSLRRSAVRRPRTVRPPPNGITAGRISKRSWRYFALLASLWRSGGSPSIRFCESSRAAMRAFRCPVPSSRTASRWTSEEERCSAASIRASRIPSLADSPSRCSMQCGRGRSGTCQRQWDTLRD